MSQTFNNSFLKLFSFQFQLIRAKKKYSKYYYEMFIRRRQGLLKIIRFLFVEGGHVPFSYGFKANLPNILNIVWNGETPNTCFKNYNKFFKLFHNQNSSVNVGRLNFAVLFLKIFSQLGVVHFHFLT